MALIDEFENQGNWLFRRRSYIPIIFLIFIACALYRFEWPYQSVVLHQIWARCCVAVSLIGLAIRGLTIGYTPAKTSGRNTRRQIAKQLNTTGVYSVVRHPLYLGNFIIGLGVTLTLFVWWLPVIYCLLFWLYYERIMFAEEAFLRRKFGATFDEWAKRTPAFMPRTSQWQSPDLPFSLKNVLRREHSGLMVTILGHGGVEFTQHLLIDRRVVYEMFWLTFIVIGTTTYFVLRAAKKHTALLDVPGR